MGFSTPKHSFKSEYCQSVTYGSRIVKMCNAAFSYFSTDHIFEGGFREAM